MSYLPDDVQATLRKVGKLQQNEVVVKEGDIYVAVDVISHHRRILTIETKALVESLLGSSASSNASREILKG